MSKGGQVESVEYGDYVTLTVAIPEQVVKDVMTKIVDITLDKAKIEAVKSDYVGFNMLI